MNKILGLDYGRKRTGVALSDALGMTAQPFDTFEGFTWPQIVDKLEILIGKFNVQLIVLGLPLSLAGDKGKMALEAERFAVHLEKHLQVTVKLWDERLTSVQSKKTIHQMGGKTGRNKGRVDRMAAALILQSYLDNQQILHLRNLDGEDA